ncbi:phosphatase PAP2 family protein [Rhizorhabdus argentea]|uniref:phosphatase PAP2 family protein n=1 Tax=Rhizorhabdus argentea TaxID=1387174 RepID=UPI0030ECCD0D
MPLNYWSKMLLLALGMVLMLAGALLWLRHASIDLPVFEALRLDARSGWAPFIVGVTRLGGFPVLGPLALAVAGLLAWRKRGREALWLLLTIASGRLMVEAIKLLFGRERPPLSGQLAPVTSYSFPSSHSAGTMLTMLALAMVFPAQGSPMLLPALAIGCVIGWSRIALGVHWPSDVLAGLGFGMLWVGTAQRWLHPSGKTN